MEKSGEVGPTDERAEDRVVRIPRSGDEVVEREKWIASDQGSDGSEDGFGSLEIFLQKLRRELRGGSSEKQSDSDSDSEDVANWWRCSS